LIYISDNEARPAKPLEQEKIIKFMVQYNNLNEVSLKRLMNRENVLLKTILFFLGFCFSVSVYSQQASDAVKPKPFVHAVDSFNVSDKRLKLFVVSGFGSGDSKTFNRIFGWFWFNEGGNRYPVDIMEYDPDRDEMLCVFRESPHNCYQITPSSKIKAYLSGKTEVTMAEDCNITITNALVKPTAIIHAVDTLETFRDGSIKSLLYVVSTNGDPKTFNCIVGYFSDFNMEQYGLEWKKIVIDVTRYIPSINKIEFSWRNRNNFGIWGATPKIANYLQGKGRNARGEIITMAKDCNIKISE